MLGIRVSRSTLHSRHLCLKVEFVPQSNLSGSFSDSELTLLANSCQPTQAEAEQWIKDCQAKVSAAVISAYGIPSLRPGPYRRATVRLIWQLWSLLYQPSNLSSLFHWLTWGRYNLDWNSPGQKPFKSLALKALRRKAGAIEHNYYCQKQGLQPLDSRQLANKRLLEKKARRRKAPGKAWLDTRAGLPLLVG